MVSGVLKVEILTEGVHSGDASGLVPSSFRILRQVLDRLEDSRTGQPAAAELPLRGAGRAAGAGAGHRGDPGRRGLEALPLGLRRRRRRRRCRPPPTRSQALLNRTWRPTLSVTGVDGFPELGNAGNVLRPYTAFKLSLRLPPLVDGHEATPAS
ncbi:MAG: peptidase dimerization domain-containing protein [Comamonadaceae bacterium]|nr:peptidase dimerization domain-containing protein [Comamonadaceae bacterium]